MSKTASRLVRPLVQKLHSYVPGEQPKIPGLIKLNTNENPYPPSPRVYAALKKTLTPRLRLYPNPASQPLREKLAKFHGCAPENIIVGNGSDELLALAIRAFAEPASGSKPDARSLVQYFSPSYSLYPVLADIHGAAQNPVPLGPGFQIPSVADLRRGKQWNFSAALSLVTTPNAPSGQGYATSQLDALCQAQKGVMVLDEAYVDFADENALELALKHPHTLVSRTFSKAYSLCFLRVGYFVGHPALIEALDKIRDSYNVNGMGQAAAEAALDSQPYYQRNFRRVIRSRESLTRALTKLGFAVHPSQANFIFARPPRFPAEQWLGKLREQKILARWFRYPETRDFLRITIGSEAEMKALLIAVRKILAE